MKYKEFINWCNKRACDGYWGFKEATTCIKIIDEIQKLPFWKRKKEWNNKYKEQVYEQIVQPINKIIEKSCNKNGNMQT